MSKISYHNHSLFSDGKNSVLEVVESAKAIGLEEVGISDHFLHAPSTVAYEWSLPLECEPTISHLPSYVAEVKRVAQIQDEAHFKVRLGAEVNFFEENAAQVAEELSHYPFDYLIGSVHIVDGFFLIDLSREKIRSLSHDARDDLICRYWELIEALASSCSYDIVGHLDFYKRFGINPSRDIFKNICRALDAIKASGMAIELNTAGWHAFCQEQYPSRDILKECLNREIPFVISADSHRAIDVGRDFQKANELLHSLGRPQFVRFSNREKLKGEG